MANGFGLERREQKYEKLVGKPVIIYKGSGGETSLGILRSMNNEQRELYLNPAGRFDYTQKPYRFVFSEEENDLIIGFDGISMIEPTTLENLVEKAKQIDENSIRSQSIAEIEYHLRMSESVKELQEGNHKIILANSSGRIIGRHSF